MPSKTYQHSCLLLMLFILGIAIPKFTFARDDKLYLKAREALIKHQPNRYTLYKSNLSNHPLYPYLLYREIKSKIKKIRFDTVAQFTQTYHDSVLSQDLANIYLYELYKKKKWQSFLLAYNKLPTKGLWCEKGLAQYYTNKKKMSLKNNELKLATSTSKKMSCKKLARLLHAYQKKFYGKKNTVAKTSSNHIEKKLRLALKENNWPKVLQMIAQLDLTTRKKSIWRFWRARALEGTGHYNNALKIYKKVAKRRNFYGFLASERLLKDYQLNHMPVIVQNQQLEKIKSFPAMIRIKALMDLGFHYDARREFAFAINEMDPKWLLTVASFAKENHWPDFTILATIKAQERHDLTLRFPLAFARHVFFNAQKYDIDPAWLFAVIRQESAFNHNARSNKGARGMMQLLPSTAKSLAKAHGVHYKTATDLYMPAVNIELGAAYLQKLLARFDKNIVLALAAYNAGPNRVQGWLNQAQSMPFDIWIETRPNHETREYLKSVLSFAAIYTHRLGAKASLIYPS